MSLRLFERSTPGLMTGTWQPESAAAAAPPTPAASRPRRGRSTRSGTAAHPRPSLGVPSSGRRGEAVLGTANPEDLARGGENGLGVPVRCDAAADQDRRRAARERDRDHRLIRVGALEAAGLRDYGRAVARNRPCRG